MDYSLIPWQAYLFSIKLNHNVMFTLIYASFYFTFGFPYVFMPFIFCLLKKIYLVGIYIYFYRDIALTWKLIAFPVQKKIILRFVFWIFCKISTGRCLHFTMYFMLFYSYSNPAAFFMDNKSRLTYTYTN